MDIRSNRDQNRDSYPQQLYVDNVVTITTRYHANARRISFRAVLARNCTHERTCLDAKRLQHQVEVDGSAHGMKTALLPARRTVRTPPKAVAA